MANDSVNDHGGAIKNLEQEIEKVSDEMLTSQEQRFADAVHEITQSVMTISRENDLIDISEGTTGQDAQRELQVADFSTVTNKIDAFNQLVELLRVTYLEQETLDFFLRYTISSSELLKLDSTHDEKYVKLAQEVSTLENEKLTAHHKEIEDTKFKITIVADEIANTQDKINEILLETTNVLDSCDLMMEELEQSREEHKRKNETRRKTIQDPLVKTCHDWEQLKTAQKDYNILNDQLSQWEKVKKSYELVNSINSANLAENETNPRLRELGLTLESLISFWESKCLPSNGWQNLEIYPQTKKFQFDVSLIYTIVITLDRFSQVKDIKVYEKKDKAIINNENLENELKRNHSGAKDIYSMMRAIVDRLEGIADSMSAG